MKRKTISLICLLTALLITVLASVLAYRNPKVLQYIRAHNAQATVSDYVDNAVLKTLEQLSAEVEQLHLAAAQLAAAPTEAKLEATAIAWHRAHAAWNNTAACQYGPSTQYDFHKRVATWPFEKVLAEELIKKALRGECQLDGRYLREEEFSGLRGFYALQYLLYREGRLRELSDISPTELVYLSAVSEALLQDSLDFEAAWCGTENLTEDKRAVLANAGIAARAAYADELRNPGSEGSRYASTSISLQEVFQDIIGVFEDLAPQISEYPQAASSEATAYWDSLDPHADMLNQLKSAENAYLGGVEGSRERSLSQLVAAHEPVLDRLVKISFAHTTYRIEALKTAQQKSEAEYDLAVRIAEAELEKLTARITLAIPWVILDPAVEPYAAYVQ
ncbi:imelysin family protein [Cerasicoccus maritimus]|uniref:imelysin family protein n=1 Tax=Cerasicoccus maritimus TaxID=490089 RepID=UPI00285293C1|nr:imelysin family protein [Cerasicoccus maritimus]